MNQNERLLKRLYIVLLSFYSGIILIADYLSPKDVAVETLHVVPVVICAFLVRSRRYLLGFLFLSTALIFFGFFISVDDLTLTVVLSRSWSIALVWMIGTMSYFLVNLMKQQETSNRVLVSIVESTSDAIIGESLEGVVNAWNRGAELIYGYTADEAIGNSILDLIVPNDKREEFFRVVALVKTGQSVGSIDTIRWDKNGQELFVSAMISPVFNEQGGVIGLSSISRNLTEQRQLEKRIIESQVEQIRLRNQILSHVSHELRTPLSVIDQYANLLLEDHEAPLSDEQTSFVSTILRNGQQLQKMIDDLMEVALSRSGKLVIKPKPIDVCKLLSKVRDEYREKARDRGIEIEFTTASAQVGYVDSERIKQVLRNLIENSLKHTSEGDSITLQIDIDPDDTRYLRVMVRDSGSGIPPHFISKVFDRLSQGDLENFSSRKGLGLGLAICRDIVHLHLGDIWVESERDVFTAFYFTVPQFGFNNILELYLIKNEKFKRPLGLILVDVLPSKEGPALSKLEFDENLQKIVEVLRRNVTPDHDLVLESSWGRSNETRIAIILQTDIKNIPSVLGRVSEGLYDLFLGIRPKPELQFSSLTIQQRPVTEVTNDHVKTLTQSIQALIFSSKS